MFLSQPSVSLQIRALEREMDITLFERRGPRIVLTPEERFLYDLAYPHVEGIDRLPDALSERCATLDSGELDIAAGQSTILYILPRFVKRFATAYPGIQLRLHSVTGRDGLAKLRADAVDFAVGAMPEEIPDDISFRPIFRYEHQLIAAPDHPLAERDTVTLADISPYPLILPPRELSSWGEVDLVFRQQGLDYKVVMEVGGWEVIKRYVEIGLGVSIVSGVCLRGHERLAAIGLAAYFPERSYGLVTRRGKFLSPAARRFIELIDPSFLAPDQGAATPPAA